MVTALSTSCAGRGQIGIGVEAMGSSECAVGDGLLEGRIPLAGLDVELPPHERQAVRFPHPPECTVHSPVSYTRTQRSIARSIVVVDLAPLEALRNFLLPSLRLYRKAAAWACIA